MSPIGTPEFQAEMDQAATERLARDNETEVDELGFAACKAEWDEMQRDWTPKRPYTRLMWNQLTFGDRERYGRLELAGAGLKIEIRGSRLSIDLPPSYAALTLNEIRWLEESIAAHVSKTLFRIKDGRQWGVADRPLKKNGLVGLF